MRLREMITENPMRALAIAAALLVAGVAITFASRSRSNAPVGGGGGRMLFSVDDGKTWFADDASKIPPFEKDGKRAVLAHVYRCADGTEFVNHLERFTPEAKQALERANAPDPTGKGRPDRSAVQGAYMAGREVKRPGDAKWVNAANIRESPQVTAVKCPRGTTEPVRVVP